MAWRDRAPKVTHPPAFASFSVDLGPVRIVVGGVERELIGGSFRDVSFYVESHTHSGGRRTVDHEFPFQAKPFVDDMGRKQQTWKIEGYVLGPDYDLHLKDLIAALQDTAGPGKLIHPYRGELQVICRSYEASEKKGEGGYATISMEFAETDIDPPAPLAVISLGDLLGGLLGAIALVIVGIAALALVAAVAFLAVRALVRSVERFIDNVAALADLLSGGDKAIFARDVERMRAKADTYARDPESLLKDLDAALDGLGAADPEAAAEGLLSAYATDEGPEPSKNADYFVAVVGAIRQLLLLKAIGFASQATYPSHSRATAMRDRLSDLLDDQAANASEEVYQAFAEVRAQIAQTIPPRGAALPDVVSHTPTVTLPSLVLAYKLYGSTALADDIVARNGLEHPGFVPADEPLEVLSSG